MSANTDDIKNTKSSKREVKSYIKTLVKAQNILYKQSETKVKTQEIGDEDGDIWAVLDKNFQASLPFIEDTIDRWNG